MNDLNIQDFGENTNFVSFFKANELAILSKLDETIKSKIKGDFAIFIPNDQVFDLILNFANLSFDNLWDSDVLIDIMYNHFAYFRNSERIVSFINGNDFAFNKKFLDNNEDFTFELAQQLNYKTKVINIYITRGILSTPNQRKLLINIAEDNEESYLARITADPLQTITEGRLKGKNLIALCISNSRLNSLCNKNNQRIFVKALLDEFNLIWEPSLFGYETPRELYRQMHTEFYIKRKKIREVEVVRNNTIYTTYQRDINPEFNPKDVDIQKILAPSPAIVEYQEKRIKGIKTYVVYVEDYMFAFVMLNRRDAMITKTKLTTTLGSKFPSLIDTVLSNINLTRECRFQYNYGWSKIVDVYYGMFGPDLPKKYGV